MPSPMVPNASIAASPLPGLSPENFISWGGALLPRIETLEPRIREIALERYYIPKLIEEGFVGDAVIDRVTKKAMDAQRQDRRNHRQLVWKDRSRNIPKLDVLRATVAASDNSRSLARPPESSARPVFNDRLPPVLQHVQRPRNTLFYAPSQRAVSLPSLRGAAPPDGKQFSHSHDHARRTGGHEVMSAFVPGPRTQWGPVARIAMANAPAI
eukprot:TRINITY_DN62548_c0_g1_i1.p1 TRINITY_DN62548_c0_g1~~TRINITY_DN62548_c0_g1_i1.p1  ORF type:complete len:212 (+),score=20.16 TRINITY_DN62548_c0_g1_i1:32-667(+)